MNTCNGNVSSCEDAPSLFDDPFMISEKDLLRFSAPSTTYSLSTGVVHQLQEEGSNQPSQQKKKKNALRRKERTQKEMKMVIPDRGGRIEEVRAEMPQWTSRKEDAKKLNPSKNRGEIHNDGGKSKGKNINISTSTLKKEDKSEINNSNKGTERQGKVKRKKKKT